MSVLAGLGAFAGGVARGIQLGDQIQEMKQRREDKNKQKDVDAQIRQAGIDAFNVEEEDPIQAADQAQQEAITENTMLGLGNIDYIGQSTQMAQQPKSAPDYTVQRFANGGMVQDQATMVTQVNNNAGLASMQPEQQAQKPKRNPGYALSKSFSAMRDKALELGRADLAMQYQQAGFQIRDRLFKDEVTKAQQAFDMTGDIGGFVKAYNDAIDDGARVDGYERTDTGYKLKINNNGQILEREFKPEQIRDMVMTFSDPAARYAAERQAMEARNKKTFETDEDIRRAQEIEKSKVHPVGLDSVLVGNDGKIVYDGSANRPTFRNEQDVYKAANDQNDPRNQLAKSMLKQQQDDKVRVAKESRAPKEPKQKSLDDLAYDDWSQKPENKGKGISDYLKEKAMWGKDIGLDTVTTSESKIDPVTGSEISKTSRTSKVPRQENKPAPKKDFDLNKYLN